VQSGEVEDGKDKNRTLKNRRVAAPKSKNAGKDKSKRPGSNSEGHPQKVEGRRGKEGGEN
jgi:hypothetical protein